MKFSLDRDIVEFSIDTVPRVASLEENVLFESDEISLYPMWIAEVEFYLAPILSAMESEEIPIVFHETQSVFPLIP